jgi:hypothetical protein
MTARVLCLSIMVLFVTLSGGAQEQPGNANNKDPRVGLKAGFRDAGEAAMNMERLSSVPKLRSEAAGGRSDAPGTGAGCERPWRARR